MWQIRCIYCLLYSVSRQCFIYSLIHSHSVTRKDYYKLLPKIDAAQSLSWRPSYIYARLFHSALLVNKRFDHCSRRTIFSKRFYEYIGLLTNFVNKPKPYEQIVYHYLVMLQGNLNENDTTTSLNKKKKKSEVILRFSFKWISKISI